MKRITFPQIVNWILVLFVIKTNFNYKYWRDSERIIAWDVISYYGYLPATFIYHDPTLQFASSAPEDVKSKIWYNNTPEGGRVLLTSCGISYLYAPFFFGSHLFAKFSAYPANGYSVPYRFGLIVSSIFYFALGLFFIRKVVSRYFPPLITAFTCLIIGIGTNLFYYTTTEPTMSHVYSFFLISAFIYYTLKWHDAPSFKYTLAVGFVAGLISLARPTNIIIILLFILWNVLSFNDLKSRIQFFLSQYKYLLLIAVCAFIIWLPQCLYWKNVTGHYFYDCYGNTNRFFFNDPKIWKGLFSYRKGWLLYTPVMTFALIGIFFLRKQVASFFYPVLIFTILNLYIIFSWWCWWYGGGFGLRVLVDCYALLAIPLAAFLFFVWEKGKVVFTALSLILLALVYFSQFQNEQYRTGAIHWDSMSKEAYWANFGKLTPVANFNELLDPIDYEKARQGER